jgi:hypothetical protein
MKIYVRQSNSTLKDVNTHKATFQAKHKLYIYIIYVWPEMFFVQPEDGYF